MLAELLKYIITISVLLFLMIQCGDMPGNIPGVETGDLKITTMFNETPTDSLTLSIDDHLLGSFQNPHIVYNMETGIHKVFASNNELPGEPQLVWVHKDILNEVTVELSGTGPYPGYHAPDFNLTDLFGNDIHLADYQGKVVFLFFFEHT